VIGGMQMSNNELNINKKNISNNVRLYTTLIAILPLLSIYSSGIPGINLGELLLLLFLIYSFIFIKKGTYNYNSVISVVMLGWYILVSTLLAMFLDSSQINDVFIRTTRFIFYLFIIFYLSRRFFCIIFASSLFKIISVFATFYIVIQSIFYQGFGIILKGFLPFIPVYTAQYETFNYLEMYTTIFYRPTSFFLEPAHYAQYVLIGLVVVLFKEENTLKNAALSAFLTFGIIMSTSGQGVLIAGLVWVIYFLTLLFNFDRSTTLRSKFMVIILPAIALIILPFLSKSEVIRNTISRIFTNSSNSAVSARSEGYLAFFLNDNLFMKLFGSGFGNTPSGFWFSGLAYILYCSGIVGFIILIAIFLKYYFKSNYRYIKMLVVLCFILSISAEIFNSYWIILFFSLIFYSNKIENNRSEGLKFNPYYLRRGFS
jgi:hypothetical protein